MIFGKDPTRSDTFYDVLDVPPSASPAEIREAYLRAKSAYNRDSIALYSLIDPSERESILQRIEEAYEILSNDEKRRQYDAHHGIVETTGAIESKVISIDRVPPMEVLSSEELLVPPKTDFPQKPEVSSGPPEFVPDRVQDLENETEWNGVLFRRIREQRNISIEEMSNSTKISKTYLQAIEHEDFKKLPALVFVRGFLVQICRILKLPQEKVLAAYLDRFTAAKSGK